MQEGQPPRRPVVLIVLDGYGVSPSKLNNAVALASTPRLDGYFAQYQSTTLQSSGCAVGLSDGQMGNSEVGHLTMGCGTILCQDLVRIDHAIETGEFFDNPALTAAMDAAVLADRPLHLLGLVSDGGVHSHIQHLLALLAMCKQRGARPLVHMISDGRDTPPKHALVYLERIEGKLRDLGGGIATVMGRYYAMDRDTRWERTRLSWQALCYGEGGYAASARAAIESAYARGETDEFIKPILLPAAQPLQAGDQVISFNFRKDRPKQIVSALADPEFQGFERGDTARVNMTCLMCYGEALSYAHAFRPERPAVTLGQVISDAGLAQFRCAETEKYPHITYFFNGGRAQAYPGERHVLVPSPKVATYDLQPEMSAHEVADAVIDAINADKYAFILVNFANGDMVGHTAVKEAAIKAVETLDTQAGRVLDSAMAKGYSAILTADHGNCEQLIDPRSGEPHTQHTTYPVPCLIADDSTWQLSCAGGLPNIAPTVLELMGLDKPRAMTAKSLLLRTKATEIAV